MYYVYLIQSQKDKSIYIGQTDDLKKRLDQHNSGQSSFTKKKMPWELVYYEAFKDRTLAMKREHNLKYFGKAYGQLRKRIGLLSLKGAG